jgi:hypothetical protein
MSDTGELSVQKDKKALGARIVETARLAVAVHLFESLAGGSQHYGRQFQIGGAGPRPAPATADRGHSRRPFRIRDDVAERDGDRGAGAGLR